jgi:two-component system, OmpR family, alkaline phosphatase synthesis response regulator PhoP
MARILLVEDESNLRESLAFIFAREGFEVIAASTGEDAIAQARTRPPDLVVLDINLPGIDGFETCERLRRDPRTRGARIVMVTARADVDDVVRGFETRADDYVTKPFHPKVLLARIHALLRRGDDQAPALARIEVGGVCLDPEARTVHLEGKLIPLTRTEFDLLHLLATHPDRVFTRENILDHVRGAETDTMDRAVDFQIVNLRKKLGDAGEVIETVRGVGYKLRSGTGA